MDRKVSKIISSLHNYPDIKYSSTEALLLLDHKQAGVVIRFRDLFNGFKLDSATALKIIENGQARFVVVYINDFTDLNAEVVVKLMEAGYTEDVLLWIKNSHQRFDIAEILKNKDVKYKSYYVYEIVKHPSLIADICS